MRAEQQPAGRTAGRADKLLAPVPDQWAYWDGTPLPESAELRWGYTTGACAAAVLTASYLDLRAGAAGVDAAARTCVDLRFGDGVVRRLPLSPALADWPAFRVIRKNGGDDPDCTHGLLVAGRITPANETGNAKKDARDLICAVGKAMVTVHCVAGVGLVTRQGLDCRQGHWAVNPGVLRMIQDNLERAGMRSGHWLAQLVIPEGTALAAKTLNKTLGVTGGLSLLGTTGLVRPFSHDAYVATVRVCLRSASSIGHTAVLCTGHRTLEAAKVWCLDQDRQKLLGPMGKASFIAIADFVGESLRAACTFPLDNIIICCMPGKLLKYAAGHDNTHAHRVGQDMDLFADIAASLFPGKQKLLQRVRAAPSMRAAMDHLSMDEVTPVLDALAARALTRFLRLCLDPATTKNAARTPPAFALLVTDFAGQSPRFYPDARLLQRISSSGTASSTSSAP